MSGEQHSPDERVWPIVLAVGGSKIGVWTYAAITLNFWPVAVWFGIAICICAAGGDTDMP